MILNLSEPTQRVLKSHGWSPGRTMDIEADIEKLALEGYQIFPLARAALTQLHGLQGPSWRFHTRDGLGTFEDFKGWMAHQHIQLYTLGGWSQLDLLVGDNGKLYLTDFVEVHQIGNAFEDALEMVLGVQPMRMHYVPPRLFG